MVVGAPGLPPLRLLNEGTVFGSVAVPPFVIWPAWALAGLIESPRWRHRIRTALVIVGVPLTVLSGSRSAWLAIGVAVLVGLVPWAWHRRHRLRPPRELSVRSALIGLGALALVGVSALVIVPRLTAVASLVYRADLWRDSLAAWATDPMLGIGPGFMPWARQAAAPDFSFPVRQPHSHNVALGVLGDAGLLGLAAAVAVLGVALVVAGPWRSRTGTGRYAGLALVGLGVGSLFEDLTFLPNFNLLAIGLLAVAMADAGAVRWGRPSSWPRGHRVLAGLATVAIAVSLAPAVLLGDASGIAHVAGIDASREGRHAEARDRLVDAMALDRWHPAPPRALAVAAARAGDAAVARDAAERAVALSPGDGSAWTNLALLCRDAGDEACAAMAAERATATASFLGLELANAAVTHESLGRAGAADDAYLRSLLSQRLTAFGLEWPRPVALGDTSMLEGYGALGELNRVLAGWAVDEPVEPEAVTDPAVRALVHAIAGDPDAAAPLLDDAIAATPDDPLPWQIAIVLRDAWGEAIEDELRAWHALTGRDFPAPDELPTRPTSTDDIASFRSYPGDELVPAAERLETDPIWPWVLRATLP
jgi:tetratricopeptide (TPR) repeat protein